MYTLKRYLKKKKEKERKKRKKNTLLELVSFSLKIFSQVLTTLGLHIGHIKQPFSPISGSTSFFKISLLDFLVSSCRGKLFSWVWGLPLSVDSIIWLIMSRTSLIFGRDLDCRTRHRLATDASFLADLREYFPSSLGSKICLNFLASERCGLTHSKSFCSLVGRFRSKGRLPVMSS